MATSKEYLAFIIEQLSLLEDIDYRYMMGEYIIYYQGKIAAYVCDDRLLVKPVDGAKSYIDNLQYQPPYPGAKDMILVKEVDDKQYLKELFELMLPQLVAPKKRK